MKMLSQVLLAAALVAGASAAQAQGKEAYDANCKKCHGATGTPAKAMAAKYPKLEAFDAAFFAKRSDDSVTAAILNGTSKDMKAYKDKLSKDEAAAITAYIKTFAGAEK